MRQECYRRARVGNRAKHLWLGQIRLWCIHGEVMLCPHKTQQPVDATVRLPRIMSKFPLGVDVGATARVGRATGCSRSTLPFTVLRLGRSPPRYLLHTPSRTGRGSTPPDFGRSRRVRRDPVDRRSCGRPEYPQHRPIDGEACYDPWPEVLSIDQAGMRTLRPFVRAAVESGVKPKLIAKRGATNGRWCVRASVGRRAEIKTCERNRAAGGGW